MLTPVIWDWERPHESTEVRPTRVLSPARRQRVDAADGASSAEGQFSLCVCRMNRWAMTKGGQLPNRAGNIDDPAETEEGFNLGVGLRKHAESANTIDRTIGLVSSQSDR